MNKTDINLRDTLSLPQTEFPMRGNLAVMEPGIVKRWKSIKLWQQIRKQSKGRELYILHDGPPYANGHLHIGHGMNKSLKDIVNRLRQMQGYDAHFIPGWDCHGLPIEWKVEENLIAEGLDKNKVPVNEFRQKCRQFAEHWLNVQKISFERLGVGANWDKPYKTMSFDFEASIVKEIGKFITNKSLYRGHRPVLWSVVEGTAMASAEVEYHSVKSPAIYVAFPIKSSGNKKLQDAALVIWTTTPWTIPSNRALAINKDFTYQAIKTQKGKTLVIAKDLKIDVMKEMDDQIIETICEIKGEELTQITCGHPLSKFDQGYEFNVPVLAAGFVTNEQGTGIVHVAPSHGEDDFALCKAHNIKAENTVNADGKYSDIVPLYKGIEVITKKGQWGDANKKVSEDLKESGNLLGFSYFKHDYPHSWRSKKPLMLRNTPQWFIALDDENQIRKKALEELEEVKFYPLTGQKRLSSMIALRPDWCVSRQRVWGVPLPIFVHRETQEIVRDGEVLERTSKAFEKAGADAWFQDDAKQTLLGSKYNIEDYDQVKDVVDVWFDSGSTHASLLENNPELKWPADLYLEGSDQHRGWFHSSLLVGVGTRNKAPFKAILTHGFTLDDNGRKMSKSLGNVLDLDKTMKNFGADIVRLWTASANMSEDQRVGPKMLTQQTQSYRRLRNTLRWMLGVMQDSPPEPLSDITKLQPLERYMLHRLDAIAMEVLKAADEFAFHKISKAVHDFCNLELSAFYFDIRKDLFYCQATNDKLRRDALAVVGQIFSYLVRWLAPVTVFTAEEAWIKAYGDDPKSSVHTQLLPLANAQNQAGEGGKSKIKPKPNWCQDELQDKWNKILEVRKCVLTALEEERQAQTIASSLEAAIEVKMPAETYALLEREQWEETCIVSQFKQINAKEISAKVLPAEGEKCPRCWRFKEEVAQKSMCNRCLEVVENITSNA